MASRRGPWSQSEDAYLVQLVHTQGALNWVRIAQHIGSRSPKQCRERYHQNLKPSLNHEPISPEEGLQIERMVGEMGKRWAEIARRLHGRSDNAVKNWWNGSMNRRRRMVVRRSAGPRFQNYVEDASQTPTSCTRMTEAPSRHQLTINPSLSQQRHVEGSLLSPASSEISRADSVDGAPSLVSDHGSNYSISPRPLLSPVIELPALHIFYPSSRRPSLPTSRESCGLKTPDEAANQLHEPARYAAYSSNSSPSSRQAGYSLTSRSATLHPSCALSASLPSTLQLPPLLKLDSQGHPAGRDSRMRLSSLLV